MNRKNLVRIALIVLVSLPAIGCQTTNGSGNPKSLPEWQNEVDRTRQQVEEGIRTIENIGDIFG